MELPVQELLDIMTIAFRKGKTPLFDVLLRPPKAPETSTTEGMVFVTKYELIENPEEGVFRKERGAEYLPQLSRETEG